MKARLSTQPYKWEPANVDVRISGKNNRSHNRVTVMIQGKTGHAIHFRLEGRHAYSLADAIVDAMENQNRTGIPT